MACSTFPTTKQIEALDILRKNENSEVLAWLALMRSIEPGFKHCSQPCGLSSQVVNAIIALKDCEDELLTLWLDMTRSCGILAGQILSFHSVANSYLGHQNPCVSDIASPAVIDHSPSSIPTHIPRRAKRNKGSMMHKAVSSGLSQNRYSTLATSKGRNFGIHQTQRSNASKKSDASKKYWCISCVDRRAYLKSDDWKKHMKEHETSFVCGLTYATEVAEGVVLCIFCGLPDPDVQHLESHKIRTCSTARGGHPSFKRRYDMVAHLKHHHVALDPKGLAEKWRRTPLKRARSCGFCISCFPSLAEQLKHIDRAHFSKHQHINQWDTTKVIQGLLLQAQVCEAWNKLSISYGLDGSTFSWNTKRSERLQSMLEEGPSTNHDATALEQAAYDNADDPEVNPLFTPMIADGFYDNALIDTGAAPSSWIDVFGSSAKYCSQADGSYAGGDVQCQTRCTNGLNIPQIQI